ncbi:response regulator [Bermanella marisrubri]|uniref:CheY-like receiver protein n=1 Tax=Bermanella marisrubri TaxID=207949 RepID=Q1MXJ7_9GAMM|nr:response regulator [Bermanella marisrubri]EAT10696.1 CheY-like receiver protein [Oceanobacter sp. RED65] [Bermanella marisrubri]QIZ82782.1 response regulator [Bermanella marisrubri]
MTATTLEGMLAPMRILAIDDLVESRSAMKKMLRILGANHVDIAMDGDEATAFINHNSYDLVISDYNLGRGRDGQQILEEARFTHKLKATATFVMLTGENAMDMVMGAIEYEPDDYITKPFTIDVMRKRLNRILKVKQELHIINQAVDTDSKDAVLKLCDEQLVQKPRLALRIKRIKGRTLISMNRYQDALDLFQEVADERPVNWAMLGIATCQFHLNQLDESETTLHKTIHEHPKYVQCFDLLSKIHLKRKQTKKAQFDLMQAAQISPKQVLRQMELGRLAYANQDHEVAEKAFRQSVKLARYSCYRSVKNYLFYAKSLQHKLSESNGRDSRKASTEIFKTLDEARALYRESDDSHFETYVIESTTYNLMGRDADAAAAANKAAGLLEHMPTPTSGQQISMAQAYLATKQHAKAQDLLGVVDARRDLSLHDRRELERTKEGISEHVVRQYTTEINDKAIEYFERGQLSQAIDLLNQATSYKEAGIAVLLNAMQAKVTYMDQKGATKTLLNDVKDLVKRIGDIPPSDERYSRWQKLNKSYQRLKRTAR